MHGLNKHSFSTLIELFGPSLCAVFMFSVLLIFHQKILCLIVDETLSVSNLYNAVFGWAAIQTGCLYAILWVRRRKK